MVARHRGGRPRFAGQRRGPRKARPMHHTPGLPCTEWRQGPGAWSPVVAVPESVLVAPAQRDCGSRADERTPRRVGDPRVDLVVVAPLAKGGELDGKHLDEEPLETRGSPTPRPTDSHGTSSPHVWRIRCTQAPSRVKVLRVASPSAQSLHGHRGAVRTRRRH